MRRYWLYLSTGLLLLGTSSCWFGRYGFTRNGFLLEALTWAGPIGVLVLRTALETESFLYLAGGVSLGFWLFAIAYFEGLHRLWLGNVVLFGWVISGFLNAVVYAAV